jgi:hypothetical protein
MELTKDIMKTIVKKRYTLYSVICMMCYTTFFVSCTEWDEFKKHTAGGEIVYPGKFDSVAVFPGDKRIRLWGKLTSDPKVTKAKIFWDNKQDSVEFDIDVLESDFLFDEIIAVEEGTKSFTLYTYDDLDNKSVGVTITGVSYGDRYRNTLSNRRIKSVAYDDAATTIYWDIIDPKLGPEAMEVSYEDNGVPAVISTPASETITVLPGLDFANKGFSWRTIFRPLPGSNNLVPIDTFSTPSSTRGVPTFVEKQLDRSLFREAFYPGDTYSNGGAGGVDAMWDEQAQNSYGGANFTDIGSGGSSPQMVTFDLGMNVQATKVVIYPFLEWWGSYYVFSTIRDYEIYGSANPSSSGALDESWTLLKSGTITKPSGLGKDNESADDKALAIAGFSLELASDAPKVRYIRIRCLKNYEAYWQNNNNGFFSVAEIRVFGMLPE